VRQRGTRKVQATPYRHDLNRGHAAIPQSICEMDAIRKKRKVNVKCVYAILKSCAMLHNTSNNTAGVLRVDLDNGVIEVDGH